MKAILAVLVLFLAGTSNCFAAAKDPTYVFKNYKDSPIIFESFNSPADVVVMKKIVADEFVKAGLKPRFIGYPELGPLEKSSADHYYKISINNNAHNYMITFYLIRKVKIDTTGKSQEVWLPTAEANLSSECKKASKELLKAKFHEINNGTLSAVIENNK